MNTTQGFSTKWLAKQVHFDWDYINGHRAEWQAKFDRQIAG